MQTPSTTESTRPADAGDGVHRYFALACAITWLLAAPVALAWSRHEVPAPYAVVGAGLSAFGPLFAAIAVGGPRRQLGEVFGRWRTHPGWVVLALLLPIAVRTVAVGLFAASAGRPVQWFYPPATAEQVAALVVFPLGEEFGWRGFAHPRMVARYGLVKGSLLLGAVWGLWHLMYSITLEAGGFDALEFGMTMLELPLYSLVIAWVFERSGRSLAVAIACHAAAHLDHIERAPRTDLRLHALHLVVLAVAAVIFGRALAARGGDHAREQRLREKSDIP
jgi:membrane protease YdiL (CAAX protease family)